MKQLNTRALDTLIPDINSRRKQPPEAEPTEAEMVETYKAIKKKRGRPVTQLKEVPNSSRQGTYPGETRATFIVREDQLEDMKRLAYWERMKVKDIVIQGIDKVLNEYKKKKGPLKDIPETTKL